jgi:ABC-type phosphate/phosphonate transport system substrate-binding protein
MRLACLPWYDLPEIRGATDALWSGLAAALRSRPGLADVPPALTRSLHYEEQWRSGHLLFGQACGYDVLISSSDRLQLIATPEYEVDGCAGPTYRSFVVVGDRVRASRLEELEGLRCVINTPTSHSGANVLRSLVAPLSTNGRFFSAVTISGAHEASLAMLRAKTADVAAIDCVTYALLERHRPALLRDTRLLHRTDPVPAPPFVTAVSTPPELVRYMYEALRDFLDAAGSHAVRSALRLRRVHALTLEDYEPIARLERMADGHDYFELSGAAS